MERIEFTYDQFLEKIRKKEPFSFSRFGDGEWLAIFRQDGENTDEHPFYNDMGDRLSNILTSKSDQKNYFFGIQNLATRTIGGKIESFLKLNDVNIRWFDSDILHKASIHGRAQELFDALQGRHVIMVAPGYLKSIEKYFPYANWIEVPEKKCWKQYKQISYDTSKILNRKKKEKPVVLIVFSMPAEILIHDMHLQYSNSATLIDIGSMLDAYVGRETRSYHKDIIEKLKIKI